MARSCTVCAHPQREAIDRALIGGESVRAMVSRYVTKSGRPLGHMALYRHRDEHLPATLVKAAEQEDVAHALDVVKQLKAINAASLTILNEARMSGKSVLALQAIDRIHKQIELQAKLLGDLDERPQVNVLVSPEWQQVRSVILSTLAPYAEARAVLASRLVAMESTNGHVG